MSKPFRPRRRRAATEGARLAVFACLCLFHPAAMAAPEEIEVYRDDLNRPGAFTLEANQNYVFASGEALDFPQQQRSADRYRLAPELSYGLTPNVELGALAIATTQAGQFGVQGATVRLRYIAPRPSASPCYRGFNLEGGWTSARLSAHPWGAELRAILGYEGRRWIVAFNPTLEGEVAPHNAPAVVLQSKLGYRVADDLILGLESYNDLGSVRRLASLRDEEQMLYLTADRSFRRFDFNIGVGHGLTGPSDGWAIKTVISVPLSSKSKVN